MTKKTALLIYFLSLIVFNAACNKSENQPVEITSKVDTLASMTQNIYTSTGITNFGYWLYTPKNPTDDMPLIVYLHGGSGRGSDLNLVISGSLPQFLYDSSVRDIPAYILMPQCPSNKTWDVIESSVIELIDNIVAGKKINSKKISLTGHSLGGTGSWNVGAAYSSIFSCIAPLSGSVSINNASNYTKIPVWAFVGSADTIVDPGSSEAIVPLINSAGGNARIKIYEGATHFDVPALAYKDQSVKLLDWMISQSKN
ncbi:MAG TPA: dienelactone hydrolase family protein [Chitinophaga sp.]|nr:dienelactone hydrolase family protein [Chitinophaga sp.]